MLDSHPLLVSFQVMLLEHIIMCRLITGNKISAIQEVCAVSISFALHRYLGCKQCSRSCSRFHSHCIALLVASRALVRVVDFIRIASLSWLQAGLSFVYSAAVISFKHFGLWSFDMFVLPDLSSVSHLPTATSADEDSPVANTHSTGESVCNSSLWVSIVLRPWECFKTKRVHSDCYVGILQVIF